MPRINAQNVYAVNARTVGAKMQTVLMPARPTTPMSAFWARLVRAIHAAPKCRLPITQNGLATQLDMSQGSVRRWYTGEGYPELDTAIELARRTGVCVEWLLTGRGDMYPHGSQRDPFFHAVFEMLSEFPDAERARTLEYLQFKLDHIRQGWASTVDDAIEKIKADTGRHRKPS
jgi:DNA-binding XRE family transcriptional regulator